MKKISLPLLFLCIGLPCAGYAQFVLTNTSDPVVQFNVHSSEAQDTNLPFYINYHALTKPGGVLETNFSNNKQKMLAAYFQIANSQIKDSPKKVSIFNFNIFNLQHKKIADCLVFFKPAAVPAYQCQYGGSATKFKYASYDVTNSSFNGLNVIFYSLTN